HEVASRLPRDLTRDIEAQTRPAAALGGGERAEQPRRYLGRHALSVVGHGDRHARVFHPGVHRELPRRLHAAQSVDRIREQIDHDLLELDRVALYGRQVRIEVTSHRDLVNTETE